MISIEKGFLTISIMFSLLIFSYAKKETKKREIIKEIFPSEIESIKVVDPNNSVNTEEDEEEPEESSQETFTLNDLIELAKKQKTNQQPQKVKKMEYISESQPPSVSKTLPYHPHQHLSRKDLLPLDPLLTENPKFVYQILQSDSFAKSLSNLLSGKKNWEEIKLDPKQLPPHDLLTSFCQHLRIGPSIVFIYSPEHYPNSIIGLNMHNLSSLSQTPGVAVKHCLSKRGLNQHANSIHWVRTLSALPANKKATKITNKEEKQHHWLALKMQKAVHETLRDQSNPLECFRDLFDHGNGRCSLNHFVLNFYHNESLLRR